MAEMSLIETQITDINERVAFSLFNTNHDEWEWCLQRHNGTEHSMAEGVVAIGLIFPKTSKKAMAAALRKIADALIDDANTAT